MKDPAVEKQTARITHVSVFLLLVFLSIAFSYYRIHLLEVEVRNLKETVLKCTEKSNLTHSIVKRASIYHDADVNSYSSNEFATKGFEFSSGQSEEVVTRRSRTRSQMARSRSGRSVPLTSIHVSGDTSKYVLGTHDNFNGNGHLRHLRDIFVDWKPNSWTESSGMMNHFHFEDGYLTVKETGLYFVYAQIYYLDEHDVNGYRVYKNDNMILQCTVSLHTGTKKQKGNTCFTAGVEFVSEGDKISLGDVLTGHYSLFEPGKSFFGLVKLGDVRGRV